jgi:malate permease and related proteins
MGAVLSAVIPVFLVAGAGYAIRRRLALDTRTLSSVNIYVLLPCLVFSSLSGRLIEWSLFGRFAGAMLVLTVAMTLLLLAISRIRGLAGIDNNAFLLTQFPNLGNFGLPLVIFAFGEKTRPYAVMILVCGSLIQNTYGMYLAQRSHHNALGALRRIFAFPVLYAFAIALLFQRLGWHLPIPLKNAVDLLADAAIPIQLLLLGIKLAETRLETSPGVFIAACMRLCVGPVLALCAAKLLGLSDLPAKVFVLQASGPVALGVAVFGVQFNVKPRFLASTVSVSLLLSLVTVSALLYFLMHIGI